MPSPKNIPPRSNESEEIEERFRERLSVLNLRGVRFAGTLIIVLVPLFSVLDYYVLNPVFETLFAIRMIVTLMTLGIVFYSFRPAAKKVSTQLAAALPLGAALSIVAMVHMHDSLYWEQSPSHYYAGLILVVVGAGQLLTWNARVSISVFGLIYLAYLIPTVLWQPPADSTMFLSNNFFLASCMVVAGVGQHFTYNLHRREVQASAALEDANDQLKELDRYKTQFFSNITHELKTPLTLILAPTEAILRGEMGDFTESQQEYFRRIQRNGLRLMKLISDLLDLAKLEDSKLRLRIEEVNLKTYLGELLSNVRPLAERKDIRLEIVSDTEEPTIWGDRHRLEQIFINFLSNAVKFTGEKGEIRVEIRDIGKTFKVEVHDTGSGIPKEQLNRIFDRFSQVDGSSTRKHGGTGIGLALAKELTQLHGGRIWAQSILGQGTTIHTEFKKGNKHFNDEVLERRTKERVVEQERRTDGSALPEWWEQLASQNQFRFLSIDDASERRIVPREEEKSDSTKPRASVLVVEDTKEMLQFIQLQLREDYTVYLAENGLHGWELVQKLKPDLVVTDYMMPEMDGMELTSRIKSGNETSHIPVIMLTAKADAKDRVAGRQAGADTYLAKPFSTKELKEVIHNLLQGQQKQAQKLMDQRMNALQIIAARIAHEIHNPINYIRNGALLAQRNFQKYLKTVEACEDLDVQKNRDRFESKFNKMVEQITAGTDRISESVNLLREYSREGYKPTRVPYNVDDAVQRIIKMVAPKEGDNRQIVYEPRDCGTVECIPQEFHEVVSNLIQNAIDATAEGQRIWVTTTPQDELVQIEVRDEGHGIPDDVKERIFSPMFTTKAPGKGMGMGLTITYQLIRKIGGDIKVHSRPGEGTTFTILWPRMPADITKELTETTTRELPTEPSA